MKLQSILAWSGLWSLATAADAADWRSRSIYQVMTDRFARTDGSTTATCNTLLGEYCGGTWQGLINQLDYIQNMGFTAVWISPVTYQMQGNTMDGTSYHGYWQQNLYEVNAAFGSVADLKALSTALHNRGMYLMVDIVVNHNGWDGDATSVDYSDFYPFNSQSQYHSYCSVDYSNQTSIQDCWLGDSYVELPDLRTEDSDVADGYQTWIQQLVANYSIDGLRVDSAKHVDTSFWSGFTSAAGVFMTGEVLDGDPSYVCPYQGYMGSVLNYPIYYAATSAFSSTSGSISGLVNELNSVKSTCSDPSTLTTFSENHDMPRFASLTEDMSLAKNIIAYTMLSDGIPIIYEGQEQHYNAEGGSSVPYNREAVWLSGYSTQVPLYEHVASLNQIRNHALYVDGSYLTYNNYPIYSDASTIAMRKGDDGYQVIAVLSNLGASGSNYTLSLSNTGWEAGTDVMEMLTCESLVVSEDGTLPVPMSQGLPRVYYPTDNLDCSGICGC